MRKITIVFLFNIILVLPAGSFGAVITESEFNAVHERIKNYPSGDRIAFWAEKFIGIPYDPDPLGEYVRNRVVVADERVDCMYMTFRPVELAMSDSYAQAVQKALTMRFRTKGVLDEEGRVTNYEERYQYGMDMIRSGKFGKDISAELAKTESIKGEIGLVDVDIIKRKHMMESVGKIRSGDIIFFVKDPSKRRVGEIIGHIGIASKRNDRVSLVHASGTKNGKGSVKKVDFEQYLKDMPFIGIVVTRFN